MAVWIKYRSDSYYYQVMYQRTKTSIKHFINSDLHKFKSVLFNYLIVAWRVCKGNGIAELRHSVTVLLSFSDFSVFCQLTAQFNHVIHRSVEIRCALYSWGFFFNLTLIVKLKLQLLTPLMLKSLILKFRLFWNRN